MSDYISKSALIEDVHKIRCQNGISEEVGYNRPLTDIANVFEYINNQPTLDETEIIRKAFERVVERLEEEKRIAFLTLANTGNKMKNIVYNEVMAYLNTAIEIVKEECGISE